MLYRLFGILLVFTLFGPPVGNAAQQSNCSNTRTEVINDFSCGAVVTPQVPNRYIVQIANADGTSAKTLWQPTSSIASTTATTAVSGGGFSNVITVASASGITLGQTAIATQIPVGAVVIAISGTSITLSARPTTSMSTNNVTFYNAQGWNGTKIYALVCTSTDTAANNLTLQISRGGTASIKEIVSLPAQAGDLAGSAPLDLFNPIIGASPGTANWMGLPKDASGNIYLQLTNADTLQVLVGTTVTSGKIVACEAQASDF